MAELDYQYLAELVKKAQDGDSVAFAELYAATYQKLYRYACSYLNDKYLAQDAVQETYISVLKSLNKLKDPQLFISWLNQIAFRVCFRIQKQQAQYNEQCIMSTDDDFIMPDSSKDPELQVIKVDQHDYLLKQIMKLPFSESQAITLRYLNDMPLSDIADLLDTSRSSVKRYLASGKKRLARLLQKE